MRYRGQRFDVGNRVTSTYRVPPFLADEVLTVVELRRMRGKEWRVLCSSPRGCTGWLDQSTLEIAEAK